MAAIHFIVGSVGGCEYARLCDLSGPMQSNTSAHCRAEHGEATSPCVRKAAHSEIVAAISSA